MDRILFFLSGSILGGLVAYAMSELRVPIVPPSEVKRRTEPLPLYLGMQYAIVYRHDPATGALVRGYQTASGWRSADGSDNRVPYEDMPA